MESAHHPGVVVLGAGSTGLVCAAEIAGRGVPVTVLERGRGAATAWAERYDALRLNTSPRISQLPGAAFPDEWGDFPTTRQVTQYLRAYASDHELDVHPGLEVERLDRDTDGWMVRTRQGSWTTRHVVVALGMYNRPTLPRWASISGYRGELVHSAHYRNADPYAGRDALVVGAGASAFEIAHDLVAGGAARVRLAVRTPPNLMLRTFAGRPADTGLPFLMRLPVPVADALAGIMRRLTIGDLSAVGLPVPSQGPFRQLTVGRAAASIDPPTIADLREGRIEVVEAVQDVGADGAHLVDGTVVDADMIVAATGFDCGLEPMVGHLGVLDERGVPKVPTGAESLPGLRFVGYEFIPGVIALSGRRAATLAAEISRVWASEHPMPSRTGAQ